MRYPRRVRIGKKRVTVVNPAAERRLLTEEAERATADSKTLLGLGDATTSRRAERAAQRINKRQDGVSERETAWKQRLEDEDELLFVLGR